MSGFAYASPMGRLMVRSLELLPKEAYVGLAGSKDLLDITKQLEGTPYAADLAVAATTYKGEAMLEVAINRLFVRRCRKALDATPYAGKAIVSAYLRRFDVQNIALILSSKAQGRAITETETFLVSSRDVPAGLFAGAMTLDDFRTLLQQPTLESAVQQLVKFGYGGTLLPRLETYLRTKDIFPLLQALDQEYYVQLVRAIRFYQGDEWNVRDFAASEIDLRNILLLLKGKDSAAPPETVFERFIEGGRLTRAQAMDLYGARGIAEIVQGLQAGFPAIIDGLPAYQTTRTLTGFEAALTRARSVTELKRLAAYPLSSAILISYLLRVELERADLRRVVYGRQYGVPGNQLLEQLVVPRL